MSLVFFYHGYQPAEAASSRPLQLNVMTFNLKYASEKGPNAWSRRRSIVRNTILSQKPDVIGTQEGLYGQLCDIAADLPDYTWVGTGREGGNNGEFSAIFYHKARFTLLERGDFWLSDTPETPGSRTWGNLIPRMTTWVLLQDVATGTKFYHFNTHFDHLIPRSRSKSAELLARRIAGRKLPVPVVVTGDFNTRQHGGVHDRLTPQSQGATALVDSWDAAQAREGHHLSTLHSWRGPSNGGRRIDWILTTGDFECKRAKVVTYQEGGRWPSDHFPVVSELTLLGPAGGLLTATAESTSTLSARP